MAFIMKSEFDNVEDLVKAKEQLAAEISSEGSVLFKIQIRPFHLTNPKKLLPSGA